MTIYKEGDTITVELTVTKYYDSNKYSGMINARYCQLPVSIRESDIKSHNPRTIQVSDMVKIRPGDGQTQSPATFKVLAVDGDEAWIKPFPNIGSRFTVYTHILERVS